MKKLLLVFAILQFGIMAFAQTPMAYFLSQTADSSAFYTLESGEILTFFGKNSERPFTRWVSEVGVGVYIVWPYFSAGLGTGFTGPMGGIGKTYSCWSIRFAIDAFRFKIWESQKHRISFGLPVRHKILYLNDPVTYQPNGGHQNRDTLANQTFTSVMPSIFFETGKWTFSLSANINSMNNRPFTDDGLRRKSAIGVAKGPFNGFAFSISRPL